MKYYTPRFLFRRYEVLKRIKGGDCFLEIGPGSLNLTEDLLQHFIHGTLVEHNEFAKEIYDKLPESFKNRLLLVIGDFMDINLNNTYDCIIACEVMEHVNRDREFVHKIYSLLNDRGRIIISVPARQKYWAKDDVVVGHYRRYEKHDIEEMLSEEKFKNISIISYGFPFINILRLPRLVLAYIQKRRNDHLSMETRSKKSGISPVRGVLNLTRIVINKYTAYPLCLISSFFNRYDFSDGYIITADKLEIFPGENE